MEIPALLVGLVHLELEDQSDIKVQMELPVREVYLVTRDLMETKENMVTLVPLDHPVHLDPRDLTLVVLLHLSSHQPSTEVKKMERLLNSEILAK